MLADVVTFEWEGSHISLNKWYMSPHWRVRKKLTDQWHLFFKGLLIKKKKQFPKIIRSYKIELQYNSNLDPTNTAAMVKLFEDTLVTSKIIDKDTKTLCRGITITPNEDLKPMSYVINVAYIGEN